MKINIFFLILRFSKKWQQSLLKIENHIVE